MSNARKFKDTTPNLPPAGKVINADKDSTAACLTTTERPPTPEEIRRYRKSYTGQPGKIVKHWGAELDPPARPGDFSYGVVGEKDGGVGDSLGSHLDPSKIQAYQKMRAEGTYDSSKKEPLGRGMSRNYQFPDEISKNPDFRFGLSGSHDAEPAATVVFPPDAPSLNMTAEEARLYKKSHGSFEPGEQKKRDYQWDKINGGIDPSTFAFGGHTEIDYKNGVAKAINQELEFDSKVKPTEFVPSTLADFRRVRADELGKVRNLGLGDHGLGAEHSYGMPSKRFDDWGAKECIKGAYSAEEQQPDPDLGRSLRRGCAPASVVTSDRAFGVPNVRLDRRQPKVPSVADTRNYGNEAGAKALLYPAPFEERGVHAEDFLAPRPKDELREIAVASGACGADEFEALYRHALRLAGAPEHAPLSVEALRRAMHAAALAD